MIKGTIKGQSLRISYPTLVSDSLAYLSAAFTFLTDDWRGLDKWATFTKGDETYAFRLTDDGISEADGLNLSAGQWTVSVFGVAADGETVERRITTKPQRLLVEQSGALDGDPLPIKPPGVGEQIMAKANEAVRVARSAEETATGYRADMEAVLDAILVEQESILTIQDGLIGGGV